MPRIVIKLVLVILCMFIIFHFSNQNGIKSTHESDKVYRSINNIIRISNKDVHTCIIIIRKSAHFLIYFILGFLVCNLLCEFISLKEVLIYGILFCLFYAISDEIHQVFIIGRSGKVFDVFIDTVASISSSLIYFKIKSRK